MKQNYFQYKDKLYQPEKGIAMGSPKSSTMAESYLQYIKVTHIKQWWDAGKITYYRKYVDDIIIIYDTTKLQDIVGEQKINSIDKNLQFKMTTENNNTINYLDLKLKRNETIWKLVYTENPQTLTPQSTTNPIIHMNKK